MLSPGASPVDRAKTVPRSNGNPAAWKAKSWAIRAEFQQPQQPSKAVQNYLDKEVGCDQSFGATAEPCRLQASSRTPRSSQLTWTFETGFLTSGEVAIITYTPNKVLGANIPMLDFWGV